MLYRTIEQFYKELVLTPADPGSKPCQSVAEYSAAFSIYGGYSFYKAALAHLLFLANIIIIYMQTHVHYSWAEGMGECIIEDDSYVLA